jgi:hypothetical protein
MAKYLRVDSGVIRQVVVAIVHVADACRLP